MSRIFSLEGTLYRVLTLIFELICLNVCLLITSLPLVTMGAALTATYATTLKIINQESTNLFADYWQAFKKNFKQSTIIFIINTTLLAVLLVAIINVPVAFLKFPLLLLLSLLLLNNELIYPLTLIQWGSLKAQYAASFGLTLKYLFYVVVSFLITLVTVVLPIFLFKLFLIWFVLGFGTAFYLKTKVLRAIFLDLNLMTIPEEE